jgi:threonylcarbamoyladenosine tRNA methylthiotransferase MtaB
MTDNPGDGKKPQPRTFRITTLGCKVNQFESAGLAERLCRLGWRPAAEGEAAEVSIINTCTVTGKASMQSRQAVRRAVKSSRENRVLVTGCYAQTRPAELASIAGVEAVVGHDGKFQLADRIAGTGRDPVDADRREVPAADPFSRQPLRSFGRRTRPFLKIQDGCNAFCTYCIVPYARGRSRSMPADRVLAALERYRRSGYHEVVLCGIHLGAWGLDLQPPGTLADLLARIDRETGIERLRLSSIEPRELTGEIIRRVAGSERFCRHFHIPLQSGDDRVLQRMKRPYDSTFFAGLVTDIHRLMPVAGIGVDVLVGFPGETREAFENTRSLIEALPVTYLHVFPFSAREGTPAFDFDGKVASGEVRERCRVMRELGLAKRRAFYRQHIGTEVEMLVEAERDSRSGRLRGMTSSYIPVLTTGGDELKNSLIRVRCRELSENGALLAEPCSEQASCATPVAEKGP